MVAGLTGPARAGAAVNSPLCPRSTWTLRQTSTQTGTTTSSSETGTLPSGAVGRGADCGPGPNTARNAFKGLWEAMGAMVWDMGAIACAIHQAMVSIAAQGDVNLFISSLS